MERKLPFGVKDGILVDITQVSGGLACGCVCPACSSPLVARKGAKTVHHFAHHSTVQCVGAYQTALHLAAKDIFQKHRKIRLPAVVSATGCGYGGSVTLHSEQTLVFDEVLLEKKMGNIIPDIILLKGDKKLFVEVAVTHFVDEKKRNAIVQAGITTLEIDLSSLDRDLTLSDLERILVDDLTHKKWIYNTKAALFTHDISLFSKEYAVTERRMALHIDNCPLHMRTYKGKSYANVIDDCFSCKYFFSSRGDDYNQHTHIGCLGNARAEIENVIAKHKKS